MNSRAHHNISKFFCPNVPYRIIDKVNSAIDNPDRKMVALQNSGLLNNKMMDFFGLTRHGHRKYNHSVSSAFVAAYMVDPKNAAELAMAHLFADRFGNLMHDRLGTSDKEVAESLINKSFESLKFITGQGVKGRNKRKQMFF